MREPLLHFLLGGALLFVLFEWVAPDTEPPDRIVVDGDRVAMLARGFEGTWGRPPSEAEIGHLVDDWVTEEVLYREALALGLDRDDLVVRRRMRQKMEFLGEGLEERAPTDEELRAFLGANAERFRTPARTSFEQVFVDPARPGPSGERAAEWLERLRAGERPSALGDRTLLPPGLDAAGPGEIEGLFGGAFAARLVGLPQGEWTGPVESAFGLHLVRVSAREAPRLPALEEVRAAVESAWVESGREEARQRLYRTLRARYDVEVQRPSPDAP